MEELWIDLAGFRVVDQAAVAGVDGFQVVVGTFQSVQLIVFVTVNVGGVVGCFPAGGFSCRSDGNVLPRAGGA